MAPAPDPEPIVVDACGHRFLAAPELADFVRDVLAPAARAPEGLAGAATIKHNRVRTVARVPAPGGALFCKRFRVTRTGAGLLQRLRGSPAAREWAALRRLRAAGLHCPEPVAVGEERRLGLVTGSFLATREVAGAVEVSEHLDRLRAEGDAAGRRALAEGLAAACARIFAAGCVHPDLHVGNFLWLEGGGPVTLDLHATRLRRRPLPARVRWRCLGKLAHSLGPCEPRTASWAREELDWLAAAYAALDPAAPEWLAAELMGRARGLEAIRLRSRDRRCLVDSTGYAVAGGPGFGRTYHRREAPLPAVLEALDAAPLATVHAHPRGRSRIETIAAPAGLAAFGARLVRKRYQFPTLRSRLEALWDAPPLRAWRAARACEVRDVPAPRALALVLERGLLLPRRATILMELLADVSMIHNLLLAPAPPPPRSRRALARAVGAVIGRLHASGLQHRDLAVQNLLVRPRAGGDAWDAWVVDLDEVRPGPMGRAGKLRALTQLADLPPAATRTDRARFFRAYLEAGGREVLAPELAAWGARGLGQRVARLLAERAERKARRLAGRPPRPAPTDLRALEARPEGGPDGLVTPGEVE